MPDMWIDVDAAVTVPVNVLPLIDDTDFKTIEEAIAYNAAGMDLNWNFVTSAGVVSQTNVTPTTGGDYDWTHVGNGIYKIEIPASGGASINNDTEGYGWFSGVCDGVLPWCGPRIGFRAAATNNALCDGALEVGLLNDAITNVKFDQSTAYPANEALVNVNLDHLMKTAVANNADMTTEVTDGTVMSNVMTKGSNTSNFVVANDSLEAIADSVGQAAPISHLCSGSTVNAGNVGAGTHADTHVLNAGYYTIDDTGAGIDVQFAFNIGADRLPGDVSVIGRFSDGGADRVHFYMWNYVSAAWEQISSSDTAFRNSAGDATKVNSATSEHVDVAGTPGDVIVRFLSTETDNGDEFRIDRLILTSVPSAGITLGGISDAVWTHEINGLFDHNAAGHVLHLTRTLVTDVASGDTATSFTLTDGCAVNDCLNGMLLLIEDTTDNHYEVRRIADWTNGRVVTLDRALGFTPVAGDHIHIMATGYGDVNATHFAGSVPVQTAGRLHVWDDAGNAIANETKQDIIAADVVNLDGAAMRGTNGASTHSAAGAADAVWDEAIAGHLGAGSTGAALNAVSAAAIADAVWDEANADHLAAGSTGKALSDLMPGSAVNLQIGDRTITIQDG